MASPILLVIITILLQARLGLICGQTVVPKTVVEGFSTNVDILCDLDRQFHPLYWRVDGLVFDLYNVPELFEVVEHEALTIGVVDRRMDGWRFQCFTVNPTRQDDETPGQMTLLTVVYDTSTDGPSDPVSLESAIHGITLNYDNLRVDAETSMLSVSYSNQESSCEVSRYNVTIFSRSDLDYATMDNTSALMPLYHYEFLSEETLLSVPSSFLGGLNYFRLSTSSSINLNCVSSIYFYNIARVTNYEDIYVNGSSASFPIPEMLRNTRSVQLIWSKDTQCICPPIKRFMSVCACNIDSTNNMVNISSENSELVISNLSEDNVTLYFVTSVSSGCNGNCNLQSIEAVYNIIRIEGPLTSIESNVFCFFDDSIMSPSFEVNLTDSTGSLTPLSGIYSNPECLSIGPNLYPDVCGPFQLYISSGGRSENKTVLPDNEMNTCRCNQEKENYEVIITSTNSTSAELTLDCDPSEYRSDNFVTTLTIFQTKTLTIAIISMASCDSAQVVRIPSLIPSTNYTVNATSNDGRLICSVQSFTTADSGGSSSIFGSQSIAMVISIACFSRFL